MSSGGCLLCASAALAAGCMHAAQADAIPEEGEGHFDFGRHPARELKLTTAASGYEERMRPVSSASKPMFSSSAAFRAAGQDHHKRQ